MDSLAQTTSSETIWAIWTVGNWGIRAMFMTGGSTTTGPTVGRGGKEIGAWVTMTGGRVAGAVVAGAMNAGIVTGLMGSTMTTGGGAVEGAAVGIGGK